MPPARTSPKSGSKRAARKPAAKTRARRASLHWRPRLPVIEQRHLDLAGLALVAAGVFLAFPLWLGWDGGEAGEGLVGGAAWGGGGVASPPPGVLLPARAPLVPRPRPPAPRRLPAPGRPPRGRRAARPAPGPAGRAPVPRRRAVPAVLGATALRRGRRAGPRQRRGRRPGAARRRCARVLRRRREHHRHLPRRP